MLALRILSRLLLEAIWALASSPLGASQVGVEVLARRTRSSLLLEAISALASSRLGANKCVSMRLHVGLYLGSCWKPSRR